jgi:hypothetical protein
VWAGLWLCLAPWTALWDHNWFARLVPALGTAMANLFVRGAVTGVGLITIAAGVRELFGVFASHAPEASSGSGPSGGDAPR